MPDESALTLTIQRVAALALVSGERDGRLADAIPQPVWDRLYDEGLLVNLSGWPGGDPEPHLTPDGEKALLEALGG